MLNQFFVYGTLKSSEGRFKTLRRHYDLPKPTSIIKDCSTKGALYHFEEYPGARFDEHGKIIGEIHVFKNPELVLEIFDLIEGYNKANPKTSIFIRTKIPVTTPDRIRTECWAYQVNFRGDYYPRIRNGKWEG